MAVKKIRLVGGAPESEDPVRTLIEQFNDLLAKLDADVGVTDNNYASTLKIQDAITGQDI